MRKQIGFTLIELLVVIAIIAIIAAILFPVMASAKKRAAMTSCLDNLKQLAAAIRMYADNNNGRCPNARIVMASPDWTGSGALNAQTFPANGQIWQYVRNAKVYLCPADLGRRAKLKTDPYVSMHFNISYTMNTTFRDASGPILLDSVVNPTKCLMLIHESRNTIDDGDFWWTGWNDVDFIHYDGSTVAYPDGHAVWKNNKQLKADMLQNLWWPIPPKP